MKTIEQWKPVDGYEGLYEVSNLGRVKSLWFCNEKILKSQKRKDGYLQVFLCRNGKIKNFLVHRLVATAFIQNPEGFKQVNHRDEDKTNNIVSNLEFCDAKYNINFGSRTERTSKAVEASRFSDFSEICLRFASTAEAGRNGYDQGGVAACCRGCFNREGNNKYRGLYWRYAS